jgi:hypothetical protein
VPPPLGVLVCLPSWIHPTSTLRKFLFALSFPNFDIRVCFFFLFLSLGGRGPFVAWTATVTFFTPYTHFVTQCSQKWHFWFSFPVICFFKIYFKLTLSLILGKTSERSFSFIFRGTNVYLQNNFIDD